MLCYKKGMPTPPWDVKNPDLKTLDVLRWIVHECGASAFSYFDVVSRFYVSRDEVGKLVKEREKTKSKGAHVEDLVEALAKLATAEFLSLPEEERRRISRDASERLRKLADWGMIERIAWDDAAAVRCQSRLEAIAVNKKSNTGRKPAIYILTEKGLTYLK